MTNRFEKIILKFSDPSEGKCFVALDSQSGYPHAVDSPFRAFHWTDEADALRYASMFQKEIEPRVYILRATVEESSPPVDRRPHSRACGIRKHEHGLDCHSNCPSCGGKRIYA